MKYVSLDVTRVSFSLKSIRLRSFGQRRNIDSDDFNHEVSFFWLEN